MLTRTDHQIERNSPTPRLVLRGGVLLGAAVLVCALAGWPRRAGAADVAPSPTADFMSREIRDMSRRLEAATGESDMLRLQLDRANALANVGAIANASPKARLVLVAPPYWAAAAAPWLAAWASDLRALAAARGARFVDAYTASRSDWLCHPTDHHPCEAAHREIGAMVRAAAFAP